MSVAVASPSPRCLNCGASLAFEPAPRHCAQCGQVVRMPTAREFMREAVRRYCRTFVALVAPPGRLTQEYVAGRRDRYVPPLRLYLAASFLFFLVVKVLGTGGGAHIVVAPTLDGQGKTITAASDPAAYRATITAAKGCLDQPGS